MGTMQRLFVCFASRRLASVGLALAVEAGTLLALSMASPASVVGVPAAVAAAIGGTVAVVFGPWDGLLVALVGAAVFGSAAGWGIGELAALGVWPTVVLAAGLFGRRVARQRAALGGVVAAQELERRRLALELHDETAQMLAAALIGLRYAERAGDPGAAAASRDLIEGAIKAIRDLAVRLRPKVLDDFGLVSAVEQLAATVSADDGPRVEVFTADWDERLPAEHELVLYRVIQDALALAARCGVPTARVLLERCTDGAAAVVEANGALERGGGAFLDGMRERVRLLNGRLLVRPGGAGARTLRVELPLPAREPRASAI